MIRSLPPDPWSEAKRILKGHRVYSYLAQLKGMQGKDRIVWTKEKTAAWKKLIATYRKHKKARQEKLTYSP